MFKILSTYICLKKYIKCNIWMVAVPPSYIKDAGFLKVNTSLNSSDNNVIWRGMFQLTSVPVLSDVVVTMFISTVVLNRNGCFWVVPVLHSVSDVLFFILYGVMFFRFRLSR
jgi:hypothetical protein